MTEPRRITQYRVYINCYNSSRHIFRTLTTRKIVQNYT